MCLAESRAYFLSMRAYLLRAAAVAALGPTIAIARSLVATSWRNPLFAVAGLGCFDLAVWGFLLSDRVGKTAPRVRA